jgi:hypothetical protein
MSALCLAPQFTRTSTVLQSEKIKNVVTSNLPQFPIIWVQDELNRTRTKDFRIWLKNYTLFLADPVCLVHDLISENRVFTVFAPLQLFESEIRKIETAFDKTSMHAVTNAKITYLICSISKYATEKHRSWRFQTQNHRWNPRPFGRAFLKFHKFHCQMLAAKSKDS